MIPPRSKQIQYVSIGLFILLNSSLRYAAVLSDIDVLSNQDVDILQNKRVA